MSERMGVILEKNLDHKGRWRTKIISMRMSPEEAKLLDIVVKLSGLTKQDYIIKRLLNQEVIVHGSPRIHKALFSQIHEILEELQRIKQAGEMTEELSKTIQFVAITADGMKEVSI